MKNPHIIIGEGRRCLCGVYGGKAVGCGDIIAALDGIAKTILTPLIQDCDAAPSDKTIRCVRCATEFSDAETVGATACPKCGCKGLPMRINHDVTIRVNVHELRILGIWAENHAVHMDNQHLDDAHREPMKDTVNVICDRLQAQLREQGKEMPLTLTREFQEVKKAHPNIEVHRDGREEII
jgi:DNA-directed RNA polymerase subunit RPC12/RpoP